MHVDFFLTFSSKNKCFGRTRPRGVGTRVPGSLLLCRLQPGTLSSGSEEAAAAPAVSSACDLGPEHARVCLRTSRGGAGSEAQGAQLLTRMCLCAHTCAELTLSGPCGRRLRGSREAEPGPSAPSSGARPWAAPGGRSRSGERRENVHGNHVVPALRSVNWARNGWPPCLGPLWSFAQGPERWPSPRL